MDGLMWERVISLMNERKMRHEDMAQSIGVTRAAFRNKLYTNDMPKGDKLYLMARELGTTVEYLMTGKDPYADNARFRELLGEAVSSLEECMLRMRQILEASYEADS